MNNLVIIILVIWLCSAIATLGTKNSDPIFLACCMTTLIGIGYLLFTLLLRP